MYENMISVKELNKIIGKKYVIIIDIRDKIKYDIEHIPSAININEENIVKDIIKYKNYNMIVIYCDYGNSGINIVQDIRKIYNINNIYNLYGGFNAYKNRQLG